MSDILTVLYQAIIFLNFYGSTEHGLVQSFNIIVNHSYARSESCLQDAQMGHEEPVQVLKIGRTLGLNTSLYRQKLWF